MVTALILLFVQVPVGWCCFRCTYQAC